MKRALILSCLSTFVVACDWGAFDDLEKQAPVVSFPRPEKYARAGFGNVVAAFTATNEMATTESFLLASAGQGSSVTQYRVWDSASRNVIAGTVTSTTRTVCGDVKRCDASTGAAAVGIDAWRDGRVCNVVSAPVTGTLRIDCGQSAEAETITGFGTEAFGAALAPLPGGTSAGVLLIGAPDGDAQDGKVYRLPNGSSPVPLDFGAARPSRGRLGTNLASGRLMDGTPIFAVATNESATKRVIVATFTGDAMTVRACIDSTRNGYGGALAFGDVMGNGELDLLIGSGAGASERLEGAHVFDGATTGGGWLAMNELGCNGVGSPPPSATVGCRDTLALLDGGVMGGDGGLPLGLPAAQCEGAGFGDAIAVGDVDGDGKGDVVVGAPLATVDGKARAGAVWVFRGSTATVDPFTSAPFDVLTSSAPSAGDELGREVAAVRTEGRDEIAAGAPGADTVYLFLCTALEFSGVARNRCLPTTMP